MERSDLVVEVGRFEDEVLGRTGLHYTGVAAWKRAVVIVGRLAG